MNHRTTRRQSPPVVIWLVIVAFVALTVALVVTTQQARERTKEVQALQSAIEALQAERAATDAQLATLQNSAAAMESRLATLEAHDPAQQLAELRAAVETASDIQELTALRATLAEIQTEVSAFQATLDELAARIEAPETTSRDGPGDPLPPEARLEVVRQRQSHNLSCESSAASMAAQYHGVPLSETDVLASLPLNDDPYLGFRGNVDGPTGGIEDYGVYAGPIQAILNARGLQAWRVQEGISGIKAAIARGNPVIAWVTYDCTHSTPTAATIDGKEVILFPYQHVVVVTGYNADGVWANDPWDGQEDFYPFADLQRAMSYFGDMAIEVAAP